MRFVISYIICCISHIRSFKSPLANAMLLPRLRRNTCVDLPNTQDVSTAIGWKLNLSVREAYLLCFMFSASLATALA